MTVAARVRIHGRVQGVWYRGWAVEQAEALGLDGWVRNRGDGAVEAHFEGDSDAVAQVVLWCREGPRSADVDDVDVTEVEPEGFEGFEVR